MEKASKVSRRSARQSGDNYRPTFSYKRPSADSNPEVLNVVSLVDLSTDSMEKKLDDFLNKMKNKNARETCFRKLDDHVNGLLDAVKIQEKKRKSK